MYHYGIMLGMVQLRKAPKGVEVFADLTRTPDEETLRPSRVGLLNPICSAVPDNNYNAIKFFGDCSDTWFVSYQGPKFF